MTECKYEYGIHWTKRDNLLDDEQHRNNMTLDEAKDWIKEWKDDGGKTHTFRVVRRPVGDWEIIDE